jgi:chorismate mutase
MKSIARASACCAAALLFALPLASPSARADGNDTALTNLIALVAQRLTLAEPAAQWKWQHHKPLADASRATAVLDDAQRRASATGVDPAFARAFFRDQIDASMQVQKALFETWRASQAPAAPAPDLATVTRPQVDRLTGPLVTALARVEPMRAEADCPIRVARALANWKDLTRYDSGRTDAMNRALGHLCEAGGVGSVA